MHQRIRAMALFRLFKHLANLHERLRLWAGPILQPTSRCGFFPLYIYIYTQPCVHIYICSCVYVCACTYACLYTHRHTCHHIAGPFSTESLSSRVATSRGATVGSASSGRPPRRASLLDPPFVGHESLSPFLSLSLFLSFASRRCSILSIVTCAFQRGSSPLSRPRRTTLSLAISSIRSLSLSALQARVRPLTSLVGVLSVGSRETCRRRVRASVCSAVSPPLLVVGPENLTRARLRHRPPYELRAYVNQYICKSFFLCFFPRCEPHFFYIITFSLSLFSLTSLA